MKVKITGNANGSSWYGAYMGETFEVVESSQYGNDDHKVVGKSKKSLLAVDTDGAIEYFVRRIDCEEIKEMPKFNIGDTVKITQQYHSKRGEIGVIIATTTYEDHPWRVSFNGVPGDVFSETEMELVEPQWMSKEAALKLCIDGAKIVPQEASHPQTHMYFNGNNFMYYGGISRTHKVATFHFEPTKWKLWTPPTPPKPKFSVDEFVIASDDQAYMRITAVGDYDDGYTYECTGYADESGDVFIEEHRLTKA